MRICPGPSIALSAIFSIAALKIAGQPKFEEASVKPSQCIMKNSLGPGIVRLQGDPLKPILMEAFKVKMDQIEGPSWLEEDCFDIEAKMPEGSTKDQVPAMLQALLAERFKLVAHKEDRPRAVYALVVDKTGPKFKEADLKSDAPQRGSVMFRAGPGLSGFKGPMTMTSLARFLSTRLDRPVQDFTALKAKYDIDLSWSPDPAIDRPSTYPVSADRGVDLPAAPAATVFTAIRESLGLRLEPRKEPAEVLVIDHVERVPTGN